MAAMDRDKLYIDGEWVEPSSTATIEVISPLTEEVIATVPEASNEDVDRAVAAARRAFDSGPWPQMSPGERADMMEKISQLLQARYEDVARTISEEMGSPISFSIMGQVFASTMVLDYYTNLAREYQFEDFRRRRARAGARATRARGRRGLHRAVERPAVHDHVEDGPGAARRVPPSC